MDKINVTSVALQNVYIALEDLNNTSVNITQQCVSSLSSQLENLDDAFRPDIQRYIQTITSLKDKLKLCIDENKAAISERLSKIPDYENQTYKKRNIL